MDLYGKYYLEHHGIKGQKWGVRRYQNKDGSLTPEGKKRVSNKQIRKERDAIFDEEYSRRRDEHDLNRKGNEIYEYGKKHGLNLDDGGGGDPETGAKYMKMWEEWEKLDDEARAAAHKKANDYVISNYGEKTVKALKREDNAKIVAGMALVPIMYTLPLQTMAVAATVSAIRTRKENKEAKTRNGQDD